MTTTQWSRPEHDAPQAPARMRSLRARVAESLGSPDGNHLLTTKQAAAYTMYTPHTLENLRSAGKGPAFIKSGGAVAYRLADLVAWPEQHRIATLDQD